MSTHNICFYGELEKIIPELSSNLPSPQKHIQETNLFLCFEYSLEAPWIFIYISVYQSSAERGMDTCSGETTVKNILFQ